MSSPPAKTDTKTILFLGATGGVGLSALRRSLAAGHSCIALCRTPSKLTSQLQQPDGGSGTVPPNLDIVQGDAHDAAALARCLARPVDAIVFSLGGRPTLRGLSEPQVCERGMATLLAALRETKAKREAAASATTTERGEEEIRTRQERGRGEGKKPRLVVVSTTGISEAERDVPLVMMPLYWAMLSAPHRDKRAMERLVVQEAGELADWTLVRGSLYTDGPATEGRVRAGMEDPVRRVVEVAAAPGYTISREDVGKWLFEECIEGGNKWVGKAAMISYCAIVGSVFGYILYLELGGGGVGPGKEALIYRMTLLVIIPT
ncbi:hypothetical protein MYCTH_2303165 [Thermothelomyces thermophilus ATCC 42464]|uniref:NAD(P)-binding domain-containing protein n=1 Tax=Thermothelomyces thermophilus (strain ATCC 42464 / BCRC 31852 / DSM 1799) TaxID=573729 RepID=G2QC22_THET4|nr:uncharacterized protein MYCTH_2303165 [Thermothelomyces thermophilus ATCC 42464]AEO57249.1 hypothetical protein MYCTH_2303165 [Thermothelomyces thermophilus ATCC 42464]